MNRKLAAGLAAAGLLAAGGTAALVTAGGTAPAAASVATATSTTCPVPVDGPLWSLVAKGTITQSQATAVRNALRADMRDHWPDMRGHWRDMREGDLTGMRSYLATELQQLVRDGTITQAQATAIVNAMTAHMHGYWGHGPGPHGSGMMGGSHMGWAS